MVDHAATAGISLRFETASHDDGAKHTVSSPVTGRWADFRALAGGLTLGERFGAALERLERLLYSVYGSRPAGYNPYIDWPVRRHPRCLWGPEQMHAVWCADYVGGEPNCNNQYWRHSETAAKGASYDDQIPKPALPIKSRSGDPVYQTLVGVHDRGHFPVGSVERDAGHEVHDPRGTGWFGGDPAEIGHADPQQHAWETRIAGDAIEVRYTPLSGLTVVGATLCWNGYTTAMVNVAGTWAATIPPQAHGTTVRWYLDVEFLPAEGPNYHRYDPGGVAIPDEADRYSYVAFSHWNPYPHGLPELWADAKKGTDSYEFSADENVQPELINLVRFTLDWIGSRFYHSPKLRPDLPQCCLTIPIRFRWSGSAPWPHYAGSGKERATGRPIHNMDDVTGVTIEDGRTSWRGFPRQSYVGLNDNYLYGQDASWLAPPESLGLQHWHSEANDCRIWYTGAGRGLRVGDVISATHIEELIGAIDYLVDYGLWLLRPIKRRVATPTWEMLWGQRCGSEWAEAYGGGGDPYEETSWNKYYGPCPENPTGAGGAHCCGGEVAPGCNNVGSCVPLPAPEDWEDCWADTSQHGVCAIDQFELVQRDAFGRIYHERSSLCAGGPWDNYWLVAQMGCDLAPGGAILSCGAWSPNSPDAPLRRENELHHCGWAAYVCGPQRCPGGCDQDHGNSLVKSRFESDCPNPSAVDTGRSAGNCFGEAWSCARRIDDGVASDGGVAFEAVDLFWFQGGASNWNISLCDSGEGELAECYGPGDVPAPPGMSDGYDWDDPRAPICEYECIEETDPVAYRDSFLSCSFDLGAANMCMSDQVWAAINLNLDGGGAPYATHADFIEGDRMPQLADYDQAPGETYEPLWTDCPCDTETGAACP